MVIQSNTSILDFLPDLYEEIRQIYRTHPHPLVIGFSGGKDSTTVLQLVWKALEALAPEERQKPVFIIASDTQVETPLIVDRLDTTLALINEAAHRTGMPFKAQKVVPTLHDSFWVNLLGRGYPAPTTRFRWCTERLKINPANRFIRDKVAQHGEVIMVLGVRESESATRQQLMNTYRLKGHKVLRRHTTLSGAYVYAPIAAFSTDDVWTYLLQVRSPWGGNNRDLAALYRSANSGECPLVIDGSTPSCGNSRFGCWVCTVAQRDSSMEAMIDNGEEWMEPLLAFRDRLAESTNPEQKRNYRGIKGRDGRVILTKEGKLAARSYAFETRKELLRELLEVQQQVQAEGPDPSLTLISEEELHEIRRIWRTEIPDWEDSLPLIFRQVYGYDLAWLKDDDRFFGAEDASLLDSLCRERHVPYELIAKLLESEKRAIGAAHRTGIHKEIAAVLNEEWREDEEEILNEKIDFRQMRLV